MKDLGKYQDRYYELIDKHNIHQRSIQAVKADKKLFEDHIYKNKERKAIISRVMKQKSTPPELYEK